MVVCLVSGRSERCVFPVDCNDPLIPCEGRNRKLAEWLHLVGIIWGGSFRIPWPEFGCADAISENVISAPPTPRDIVSCIDVQREWTLCVVYFHCGLGIYTNPHKRLFVTGVVDLLNVLGHVRGSVIYPIPFLIESDVVGAVIIFLGTALAVFKFGVVFDYQLEERRVLRPAISIIAVDTAVEVVISPISTVHLLLRDADALVAYCAFTALAATAATNVRTTVFLIAVRDTLALMVDAPFIQECAGAT